jgi:hypothetical protein
MVKIVGQAGTKVVKQQELQTSKREKEGLSKFEQKLTQLDKGQPATGTLPPEATQISPEQRRILESNLRKGLERGNAQEILKVDLRGARTKLDGLSRQVNAAPKTSASDAIRNRLNSIEAQYLESDKLMRGMNGLESPRDMLQLQMKMYTMTQNIEIMMKFVEQGTTGFKDIVHTQV